MSATSLVAQLPAADPGAEPGAGILVDRAWLRALLECIAEVGDRLAVLEAMAPQVAEMKSTLDEYRPLLDEVRGRMDRGARWRRTRGGE